MGANAACCGRIRYSCGFVAPSEGQRFRGFLLSCVLCVRCDMTTMAKLVTSRQQGDAPWRTKDGAFLLG